MEAFSLFCTVFINALIVLGLLVCIYLYFFSGLRALRKLKPSCYISYNKNHFDKDFELNVSFVVQSYLQKTQNVLSVQAILVKIKNIC